MAMFIISLIAKFNMTDNSEIAVLILKGKFFPPTVFWPLIYKKYCPNVKYNII